MPASEKNLARVLKVSLGCHAVMAQTFAGRSETVTYRPEAVIVLHRPVESTR